MATLSVPKVTIGKSGYKLADISLNHDCSTSSDWGFCQPVMVKKMIANSTLHLNALRSIVRVSPLVKPTFGSAAWKTYHYFVKIAELYPPYEYFLSGKPYFVASQSSNYIPTQMPWVYVSDLTRMLLGLSCNFCIFYEASSGQYKAITPLTQTVRDGIVSAFIAHTVLSNGQESGITATSHYLYNGGSVNMSNADFVIEDTVTVSSTSYHIQVCFSLTPRCKNIRKVLLGCGYQLDPNLKREVCILPLMAYYRAWFELFAPKRDLAWSATNAFNILDYCRENAVTNITANNYVRAHFKTFLQELGRCFYTCDPDFISSHIPTPSVGGTNLNNIPYGVAGAGAGIATETKVYAPTNALPTINGVSSSSPLTSVMVRLLDRLTKMVNKDSQIAQRLDLWLSAHGFGRSLVDKDPYRIGADSVGIDIQSVMSTADTENAGLGDYAGTAFGAKPNDKYPDFHYTTDAPGYWITIGTIVPDAGWYQGLAPDSGILDFRRYDEYFGEWDAVGFEVSNKDQVVCDGSVSTLVQAGSDPVPFGYIPRYSRHKVTQNICNGDVSLRSLRNDALPYTLDRFITPKEIEVEHLSGEGANEIFSVVKRENDIPIADPVYRYIGLWNFIGNFDRIFQLYDQEDNVDSLVYEQGFGEPDHFIIHNYFDMTYMAPMLSMKDSYDTDSFEASTMDVTKA